MLLTVDDQYTHVSNVGPDALKVVRSSIRARPAGYRFMPAYKAGRWDGYISLLKNGKFPTGLLGVVTNTLEEMDIRYQTRYSNSIPEPTDDLEVVGFEARHYQLEAVKAALASKRGVLHMATNAGKTLICASIIQATGNRAVVVVPSRALLVQTADKLSGMLGVYVGRMGAGYDEPCCITVTTMASLKKLVTLDLSGNMTLIVDETHHVRAGSIFDYIFDIPGPYRYGMSGTPLTYDDLSDLKLIGATGPIIYTITNSELIANNYSTPPIVRFIDITEPSDLQKADYYTAYRDCIVCNTTRNQAIANICLAERARGPILVLVNWVQHALVVDTHITKAMPLVCNIDIATGQDSSNATLAKLEAMRNGELDVLTATDVFGEGIDIPSIATLILAGGGKSHIKLLQRVGRGMRKAKGKEALHVYDFLDDTNKHLLKHSDARYKLYATEGFDVGFAKL